jgi:hypothetical protein
MYGFSDTRKKIIKGVLAFNLKEVASQVFFNELRDEGPTVIVSRSKRVQASPF